MINLYEKKEGKRKIEYKKNAFLSKMMRGLFCFAQKSVFKLNKKLYFNQKNKKWAHFIDKKNILY